jgi:hypothetical protein
MPDKPDPSPLTGPTSLAELRAWLNSDEARPREIVAAPGSSGIGGWRTRRVRRLRIRRKPLTCHGITAAKAIAAHRAPQRAGPSFSVCSLSYLVNPSCQALRTAVDAGRHEGRAAVSADAAADGQGCGHATSRSASSSGVAMCQELSWWQMRICWPGLPSELRTIPPSWQTLQR